MNYLIETTQFQKKIWKPKWYRSRAKATSFENQLWLAEDHQWMKKAAKSQDLSAIAHLLGLWNDDPQPQISDEQSLSSKTTIRAMPTQSKLAPWLFRNSPQTQLQITLKLKEKLKQRQKSNELSPQIVRNSEPKRGRKPETNWVSFWAQQRIWNSSGNWKSWMRRKRRLHELWRRDLRLGLGDEDQTLERKKEKETVF